MSMTRRKRLQYAEKFFVMAHDFQNMGYYSDAAHYYTKSIRMYPTPEAYTHLGWAHSFLGDFDRAIEFCKVAISLDPDYGNPYNDIGAYLVELGDLDGAIPWLEKAKQASRYEPRQYPYVNLARIYLRRGQWSGALQELKEAVRIAPRDPQARKLLHELLGRFN